MSCAIADSKQGKVPSSVRGNPLPIVSVSCPQCPGLQKEVTRLGEKVVSLENENTRLGEKVVTLENENTRLGEKVASLKNDVKQLQEDKKWQELPSLMRQLYSVIHNELKIKLLETASEEDQEHYFIVNGNGEKLWKDRSIYHLKLQDAYSIADERFRNDIIKRFGYISIQPIMRLDSRGLALKLLNAFTKNGAHLDLFEGSRVDYFSLRKLATQFLSRNSSTFSEEKKIKQRDEIFNLIDLLREIHPNDDFLLRQLEDP